MSEPNRLGILLDDESLPWWLAKAVATACRETDVEVTELVVNATENSRSRTEQLERLVELRAWAPVALYKHFTPSPGYTKPVPVRDIPGLEDATLTRARAMPRDGLGVTLEAPGVEALKRTDVGVLAGYGILMGDALGAPDNGILSFHHGDLTKYRGQPPGFWEFLHDEQTCGITVQRIKEQLDAGEIFAYRDVYIGTNPTYESVRRDLYVNSPEVLVRAVENALDDDFSPREPDELGDLYRLPTSPETVAKYLYLNAVRSLVFGT